MSPLERLRHHVSGAIARGEATAVVEVPAAEPLTFTRVPSDANGNPRYAVHFLNLNTRAELDRAGDDWIPVSDKYAMACKRANTIGGRRYHTKRYGGGIVFQSYSIDETAAHISRVTGRQFVAVKD